MKNRIDETKKRKTLTILGILIVFLAGFALYNAKGEKPILKSEYQIEEKGYLDDIELTLQEAKYINNNSGVEISFAIKNKRKNTITINPDEYFKFYDINKVQIPNVYTNEKNIIKKDETIIYKLQYDNVTQKELYEIYFYSQIVENNVKFTFKSSDIKIEDIKDIDKTNVIQSPKE